MSSWQQQNEKAIAKFLKGFGWGDVYRIWRDRISDFVTPITPLFLEVALHDPGNPHRDGVELAWWARSEVEALRQKCQQHFDQFPGTYGPTHSVAYQGRKGELQTLEFLWAHRKEPEEVAAVLLSASLFSRLNSRRGYYPEKWPKIFCIAELANLVAQRWQVGSGSWHHANTGVLPYTSEDFIYQLDDIYSFVRYLAEEHAALLHQFVPVAVSFTPERKPQLKGI